MKLLCSLPCLQKTCHEYGFTVLITITSLMIFSLWALLAPANGSNVLPMPVASADLQSLYSWQPIIKSILQNGALFPMQPDIDSSLQGLRALPYFSVWLQSLMIAIFGVTGALWIGQALLPSLTFVLLVKIYHRHVSRLWSAALAAVGVMAFSGYPFRQFLRELLQGIKWHNLGAIQMPEISQLPVPAISACVFLALFLISTKPRHLTFPGITTLTIAWSLYTQFHALDALFGLAFWFMFFPVRLWRQNKEGSNHTMFCFIAMQAVLALLLIAPLWWIGLAHPLTLFVPMEHAPSVGWYYYTMYFLCPLLGIVIAYIIRRIDFYEIFTRFWHIYVLLLLECVFIIFFDYVHLQANLDSVQNRIALFFLHFYYYVPIIYYLSRPESDFLSHQKGHIIGKWLSFLFGDASKIYLSVILLMIVLFGYTSAEHHATSLTTLLRDTVPTARNEYQTAQQILPKNSQVIFNTPLANLWASTDLHGTLKSAWVNRFSNTITEEDAIKSLLLQARILGWKQEDFVRFMSPGSLQQNHNTMISFVYPDILDSGLGYWLVYHKAPFNTAQHKIYNDKIQRDFIAFDTQKTLRQMKPWYIVTASKERPIVPVRLVAHENGVNIYQIENTNDQ